MQWKDAYINPVSKSNAPPPNSDYGPISITSTDRQTDRQTHTPLPYSPIGGGVTTVTNHCSSHRKRTYRFDERRQRSTATKATMPTHTPTSIPTATTLTTPGEHTQHHAHLPPTLVTRIAALINMQAFSLLIQTSLFINSCVGSRCGATRICC